MFVVFVPAWKESKSYQQLLSHMVQPDDDLLNGDDRGTFLGGGDGNDTIFGNGGDDVIFGDAGSDELYGGNGDDLLDASGGSSASQGSGDIVLPGRGSCHIMTASRC